MSGPARLLMAAGLLALGCGGSNAASGDAAAGTPRPIGEVAQADSATLAAGEQLFVANCARCHGSAASGTQQGPPLVHVIYKPNHHSDVSFQRAAAQGVRAHHWNFGDMPPVPGVTPDDVANIVAYVRHLQRQAGMGSRGEAAPRMRFDLVDVFTDRAYAGNALAVVRADRELETAAMQAVAREFNLSETVFLMPPAGGGDVTVRIFTPGEELPLAGHPTLGSAAIVAWERLGGRPGDVDLRLEERVGAVAVHVVVDDDQRAFAWLTAPRTELGAELDDRAGAAEALSLTPQDVVATPRLVTRPVPYLLVQARGLDAVGRARVRLDAWERLARADAHGMIVYCLEAEEAGASVHGRMFAPSAGIVEDPATGSAAAPLGTLLVERGELGVDGTRAAFVFEQGYEMGRPSRLHVELTVEGGAVVEARVGGGVARVAWGELLALP